MEGGFCYRPAYGLQCQSRCLAVTFGDLTHILISNKNRLYTRLYTVYRRFLFIMPKLLNINTLYFLTSKIKFINTS